MRLVRIAAMTRAERLAVAMIARLSPPLMIGTIIASERIPSSGIWNAIARSVSPERKSFGASTLKNAAAITIRAPSIVIVGSRAMRPLKADRIAFCGTLAFCGASGFSSAITVLTFLLAHRGESGNTHAEKDNKARHQSEGIGRNTKQRESVAKNAQQHNPEYRAADGSDAA